MFKVGDIVCGTEYSNKRYGITNSSMKIAYVTSVSECIMDIIYLYPFTSPFLFCRFPVSNDLRLFELKKYYTEEEINVFELIRFIDGFLVDSKFKQNKKLSNIVIPKLIMSNSLRTQFLTSCKNKDFNTFLSLFHMKFDLINFYKG